MSRRAIHFNEVVNPPRPIPRALRHPFFSWAGLRAVAAQHTAAEHLALQRHARNRRQVVEIGVAEGASAIGLRDGMDPQGNLYLIDPYHLSRVRSVNFLRRAARRAVFAESGPNIFWLEEFSHEAARKWNQPIDFLLIDGDHSAEAVQRDWDDWHPHVVDDGMVVFHDARLFPSGWTAPVQGPVSFVDRTFRQTGLLEWGIVDEVDSLVFLRKTAASTHRTTKARA